MKTYIGIFVTIIFLCVLSLNTYSIVSAQDKTFSTEDLEKYKSTRDKKLTEDEKEKESDKKLQRKQKQIDMEEKMWRNVNGSKKQKVIIEKE